MLKEEIKKFFKNKLNWLLLAIIIFTIVIRLKYFFTDSTWNDSTFYMWYVEHFFAEPLSIFANRVLSASYLTVFFLIAAFRVFIWDILLAGRAAMLTLTTATVILTYLIGKELKNRTTGIIAALLLTVNPIYWLISNKVLLDAPLAATFAFVIYSLIKFEKLRNKKWALILALAVLAATLTKFTAYLVFPMLGTYFILAYFIDPIIRKQNPIQKTKQLLKNKSFHQFILYGFLVFIPTTIIYLIKYKSIIPRAGRGAIAVATEMATTVSKYNNYSLTFKALPGLLPKYTLILFLIGLFFCLVYRKKIHYMLISYIITFQIYITLLLGGILEQRHILPALPGFLVLAAYSITEIKYFIEKLMNKKISKWLIIILVIILICYPLYQQGKSLNDNKMQAYIGYQEAGEWLKENVDPKTSYIMAGAPGFIRLFSNFEFVLPNDNLSGRGGEGTKDGVLYYGLRLTKEEFELDLKELEKRRDNIYLEMDLWEAGNQGWAYPLSQEKFSYVQSLGFELVHMVEREVQTQQGMQKIPVVFIFKKQ